MQMMVPFINAYPVDGDLWELNGITTLLKVIFPFPSSISYQRLEQPRTEKKAPLAGQI